MTVGPTLSRGLCHQPATYNPSALEVPDAQ